MLGDYATQQSRISWLAQQGLYSRYAPLGAIRTHMYDEVGRSRVFSRDCLEVELKIPGGKSLYVLCNHLKSQGYGSKAMNDRKRRAQAERIATILDGYDLTQDFVVVLGDFNDSPEHAPLAPLMTKAGVHDVFDMAGMDLPDRWTYYYQSKSQIDYLLVSEALKAKFVGCGTERRGMWNIAKLTGNALRPFAGITGPADAASDHAAVWAEFDL